MLERLGIGVRALVYLRDIARSLERLVAIAEHEFPARRGTKPRMTEISTMDVVEVDRRWVAQLQAAAEGVDIEDDLPPPDDKAPS
jgi:hypothetical protein